MVSSIAVSTTSPTFPHCRACDSHSAARRRDSLGSRLREEKSAGTCPGLYVLLVGPHFPRSPTRRSRRRSPENSISRGALVILRRGTRSASRSLSRDPNRATDRSGSPPRWGTTPLGEIATRQDLFGRDDPRRERVSSAWPLPGAHWGAGGSAGIARQGRSAACSYFSWRPCSKAESRWNFSRSSSKGAIIFRTVPTKRAGESCNCFILCFIRSSHSGMPVGLTGGKRLSFSANKRLCSSSLLRIFSYMVPTTFCIATASLA